MYKSIYFAIQVALASVALTAPIVTHADNIVTNQWYTGTFTTADTPLQGWTSGYAIDSDGPILPTGTQTALPAPSAPSGALSAVITLSSGGYLLVTDTYESGDQFQMMVNGTPAGLAVAGATGLSPGGQASYDGLAVDGSTYSGLTSYPTAGDEVYGDISAALLDANFSSGTFYLPPGVDTITGEYLGTITYGVMDFIVEPAAVPEPTTMLLLGSGLIGLAGLWRKFKK